jgi:NitT/TauT family transport system substrate-binding protein
VDRGHAEGWSRREFLGLTLAGTAGLLGLRPEPVAAEPPETTMLRLVQIPTRICEAPQYVAEDLLRSEGFTEVQYIKKGETSGAESALASGEAIEFCISNGKLYRVHGRSAA